MQFPPNQQIVHQQANSNGGRTSRRSWRQAMSSLVGWNGGQSGDQVALLRANQASLGYESEGEA